MDFGYYPRPYDRAIEAITIRTLPNLTSKESSVRECGLIDNGWRYAPQKQRRDFTPGRITKLPYPSRIFGLPKTHAIEHSKAKEDDHLKFLIWCFGFFTGMRMSETEGWFLDATPIEPHTLVNFYADDNTISKAISFADKFWTYNAKNKRIAKALAGVIHSYFLSRTPTLLTYEKFIYRYIALDGCHFVCATVAGRDPKHGTHAQRIAGLCNEFGIRVPKWADVNSGVEETIIALRNETLHEGLFSTNRSGFGHPGMLIPTT